MLVITKKANKIPTKSVKAGPIADNTAVTFPVIPEIVKPFKILLIH